MLLFLSLAAAHERAELTDTRLWKLAKRILSAEDLLTLAIMGLHVEEDIIDRHLRDQSNSICIASFNVLKEWRISQPDRCIAYTNMCEALRKVGMNSYVVF